ncbi:MAG TPA: ABC transporter permease [Ktedonobacterales bacterium]|jgi:peptide/nickel transport system permease protein
MDLQKSSEHEIQEPMAAGLFQIELEVPAVLEETGAKGPAVSPLRESLRRLRRDKRAMTSVFVLGVVFFISIVFPPIYEHVGQTFELHPAPGFVVSLPSTLYHSPDYQDATRLINMPNGMHWLGTDDAGQDILARLLKGWQVSIFVAIAVEIQDILFGVFFGVLAGYFGGMVDTILARFTDLMFAFPGLLFVILVTAIFGQPFQLQTEKIFGHGFAPYGRIVLAALVIGFIVWPQMARFMRGQTLQLKEQQFIEAARTNGSSNFKIIRRHILPNIASLVIVVSTLNMAATVVAEGALSLLGLGVQRPGSSLGLMIFQYSSYLQAFPFEIIWPILALVILVLSFSFIGDGLRDAFDPRSKD